MPVDMRKRKLPEGEIIPITFDYVFTSIFNNPNNIVILENFLSLYLDIPLKEIKGNLSIKPRDLELEDKKSKNKQVDVLLDYEGKKYNIELNNYVRKNIMDRNIVLLCNIHSRQLKYSDNSYSNIEKSLQINLNNDKGANFIEKYYLKNEKNDILSEKFEIDIIHMASKEEICYNDRERKLHKWCQAFITKNQKEFMKIIGEDIMEEEAKNKLVDEVEKFSTDEGAYQLYTKLSDEEMIRNTIRDDSKEEGKQERNIEIATVLLEKGENIGYVAEITGLEEKEVEDMAKFLKSYNPDSKSYKLEDRIIEIVKNMLKKGLDISLICEITGLTDKDIMNISID